MSARNLAVADHDYFYLDSSDTSVLRYETPEGIGAVSPVIPTVPETDTDIEEPERIIPEVEFDDTPPVCCPAPDDDDSVSIANIIVFSAIGCFACSILLCCASYGYYTCFAESAYDFDNLE